MASDDCFDDDDLELADASELQALENAAIASTQAVVHYNERDYQPDYTNVHPEYHSTIHPEYHKTIQPIDTHYDVSQIHQPKESYSYHDPHNDQSIQRAIQDDAHQQVELLRVQLAQLMDESARLKTERDRFERELRSKQGEISIIRSNALKTKDQFSHTLQETKQQLEQAEKTAAEKISMLKAELDRLQTETKFQLGELRGARSRAGSTKSTTLSAEKSFPVRKGEFPSRAAFELKEAVHPVKKRRRMKSEEDGANDLISTAKTEQTFIDYSHLVDQILTAKDLYSAQELRILLDGIMHVKVSGSDRTCLEALQTYFFPSQNTQSLANVFWQDILTSIDIGHSPSSCIISNLIQLWSTCIQQQHFDPVEYIFKLLSFAFLNIYDNLLDADGIYTMLADSFQTTLEPYALARMKENTHALRLDQVKVLFECVLSAVDCPLHKSHLLRFWQVLRIDFILMLLNARQNIEIVHGTIKLLMSSVREDDFGPPCSADIRPRHSNLLLDASTRLLTESSRTLAASKKQQVRLDIIDFLHSIAFSGQPGITYLFNSNQVIPRLVKRISAELNSIYDQIEILDDSLRLIKKSVRTLHAIVTIHNPEHLAAKLASTLGAVHAHIEAMTRLSFGGDATDRLTDISDLARDLLELTVSPEEGDAIFELFES